MSRASSSLMYARTLMWRTIVAIIRGGNFSGAAWQRSQFARNRFSPSARAPAPPRATEAPCEGGREAGTALGDEDGEEAGALADAEVDERNEVDEDDGEAEEEESPAVVRSCAPAHTAAPTVVAHRQI